MGRGMDRGTGTAVRSSANAPGCTVTFGHLSPFN